MPVLAIVALIVQYGPEAIALIEAIVAAVKPLFANGTQPTPDEIRAAIAEVVDAHAAFQATEG